VVAVGFRLRLHRLEACATKKLWQNAIFVTLSPAKVLGICNDKILRFAQNDISCEVEILQ